MSIEDLIRSAVREEVNDLLAPLLKRLSEPEQETYRVSEVASLLGVDRKTVERMVRDGKLPRVPHTGTRIVIPRHAVRELLQEE